MSSNPAGDDLGFVPDTMESDLGFIPDKPSRDLGFVPDPPPKRTWKDAIYDAVVGTGEQQAGQARAIKDAAGAIVDAPGQILRAGINKQIDGMNQDLQAGHGYFGDTQPPPIAPLQPGDSLTPKAVSQGTQDFTRFLLNEFAPGNPDAADGISKAVGRATTGLGTPESIATLPLFEFRAGRAALASMMAASAPEQIAEAHKVLTNPEATSSQKWEALGDAGIQLAMTAAVALHIKPEQVRATLTPEEAAEKAQGTAPAPEQAVEQAEQPKNDEAPNPATAPPQTAPGAPVDTAPSPSSVISETPVESELLPNPAIVPPPASEAPNVPSSNVPTPGEIVDQPVNKTGRQFSRQQWSYNKTAPDVLDAINDLGGVASASQQKFVKGEYDAYNQAFGTGMATRLRKTEGGLPPDKLVEGLKSVGYHFDTTDEMYQAVEKAAKARQGVGDVATDEARELRHDQERHEDFRLGVVGGEGAEGAPKAAGDVLAEGSTFSFQGDKFKVVEYDPESETYVVQDGRRFGRQYLHADESFHPDPGSVTGESSAEFGAEGETPAPGKAEDPFEMQLDDAQKTPEELAVAAKKKAMQEEMDRRRTKRLGAPDADTTMDMLDPTKADNPLLAYVPKPVDSEPIFSADNPPKLYSEVEWNGEVGQVASAPKHSDGTIRFQGFTHDKYVPISELKPAKPVAAKEKGSPQPEIIGMGGAIPAEFGQKESFVSNMFAAIDKERAEMGKPPMPETQARSWDADNATALNRMNADPNWIPNLIEQVKKSPRPLLSWENAGLVWQRAKWKAEADNALQRIARAFDDGREDDLQQAKLDNAVHEDKLNELDEVVGRNGTGSEAGRSLQAQKMAAGEDFSLVEMRLQKRAANNGARLTEAQEKEVADLHAKIEATQKEFEQHKAQQQERISKLEADAALNRIKSQPTEGPKFNPKVLEVAKKIVDGWDKAADESREALKKMLGRTSAGLDPTVLYHVARIGRSYLGHAALDLGEWSEKMVSELGETVKPYLKEAYDKAQAMVNEGGQKNALEAAREMRSKSPEEQIKANSAKIGEKIAAGKQGDISWYVQRIARLFVDKGITDREKLIDAVHGVLQEHLPDITRRETMDAISGYGDFKQLSKDQLSLQLRGMKGEMQQLAKLEDMAKGQPPLKTGVERRTPTEAERRLVKLVNESKFRFQVPITDPATQLKSALDTFKTNMRNRTADLQDKIDRGDYQKGPKRALQLDNEAMRLKAENERVKQQFKQGLNRDRLKQRTSWEKVQDTVVKWRRGFILSGPVTLAKLTSAALARAIITPVEEGIGAGIGKVFPRLSEGAPREGGGFNTRAEVKAITEGVTTGMRDAWSTLRTGKSPLDLVHGKDPGLPQSFIDIFGNIHGALKAPVKRAEFARSFEKRADYYARQGVDVTDPFVQTRIGLESYQDAQRAIFMQKNWLVNKISRALKADVDPKTGHPSLGQKALETAGSVLMPIRRVPTNIVAETMQYAIGSVTGSVRLAKAYHDGIANLKPEEADLVMRELKKGSLGGAVMLLGFLSPHVLGGFYQQGQKRDKKDIAPDAARVGDVNVPPAVIHNPWMSAAQIGATVRRVADSKLRKKDKETQGLSSGAMAGAIGLADSTPFIRETTEIAKLMNPYERGKWLGEMAKSMVVPQGVNTLAQYLDQNSKGETVKRDPKTALQAIETGIPGLRQNVPAKK